ncbi:hypothetical protein ACFVXQ_29860, partial [Kitasatospora sp. NPDC058263]
MNRIPEAAARLTEAAEQAGWTVIPSPDGPAYLFAAVDGAGREILASWVPKGAGWRMERRASIKTGEKWTTATLSEAIEAITAPAPAQAPVPTGAAKLHKAAEQAGWTVTPERGEHQDVRSYTLTGTNLQGEQVRATWTATGTGRWQIHGTPAVRIEGGPEWIGAKLADAVAVITNNPAVHPIETAAGECGSCDHVGRTYCIPASDRARFRIGRCAEHIAEMTGCDAATLPTPELTADECADIAEVHRENTRWARTEALAEWAGALYWSHHHDVPSAFDDQWTNGDAESLPEAYAAWREEQGNPLTAAERVTIGLAEPTDEMCQCQECGATNSADEACGICGAAPYDGPAVAALDIEEPPAEPQPLTAAQAAGHYTVARTAPGLWQVTAHGHLYTVTRTGPGAYTAHHLIAHAGATPVGDVHASLTAAASAAKAHSATLALV